MTVEVEVTPEVFSDKVRAMEEAARAHRARDRARARYPRRPAPGGAAQHPRSEGKARRVIDKRNG
jgi:phenylacetate-CoA ligase